MQGLGQEACGKAWRVVEASRIAVTRLEAMMSTIVSDTSDNTNNTTHASQQKQRPRRLPPPPNSSTMRASLADSLGEIAKEEEIISLRKELQECREDLLRDEDIFATKVRELKSYRKQIRQLQQENSDLLRRQQQQQQQQSPQYHRLQQPPSSIEEKHGKSGTREEGTEATTAASAGVAGVADKKGFWDKKIAEAASKQSSPEKQSMFDAAGTNR